LVSEHVPSIECAAMVTWNASHNEKNAKSNGWQDALSVECGLNGLAPNWILSSIWEYYEYVEKFFGVEMQPDPDRPGLIVD